MLISIGIVKISSLSSGYLLFSGRIPTRIVFPLRAARSVIGRPTHTGESDREFFPPSADSKGAPDGAGTSVELIAGRTMSR